MIFGQSVCGNRAERKMSNLSKSTLQLQLYYEAEKYVGLFCRRSKDEEHNKWRLNKKKQSRTREKKTFHQIICGTLQRNQLIALIVRPSRELKICAVTK